MTIERQRRRQSQSELSRKSADKLSTTSLYPTFFPCPINFHQHLFWFCDSVVGKERAKIALSQLHNRGLVNVGDAFHYQQHILIPMRPISELLADFFIYSSFPQLDFVPRLSTDTDVPCLQARGFRKRQFESCCVFGYSGCHIT